MKIKKLKTVLCIFILALAVSLLSAQPGVTQTQALGQTAELQAVGGASSACLRAIGLGLGLAAAALSPCGVLCASLAWYDILAIMAYCD